MQSVTRAVLRLVWPYFLARDTDDDFGQPRLCPEEIVSAASSHHRYHERGNMAIPA